MRVQRFAAPWRSRQASKAVPSLDNLIRTVHADPLGGVGISAGFCQGWQPSCRSALTGYFLVAATENVLQASKIKPGSKLVSFLQHGPVRRKCDPPLGAQLGYLFRMQFVT